jgi:hypothetical protein
MLQAMMTDQSISSDINDISPGDWTVVTVPAAAWLFGSGLTGLVGIARGRVNKARSAR